MSDDLNDIKPILPKGNYDPAEVALIGTQMEPASGSNTGKLTLASDFADALTLTAEGDGATMALIYAYAYEGHVYRLVKPRIMVVSGTGKPYEGGAENAAPGALNIWRLSKHAKTVSIEVESGSLNDLVLEANKPGNRSIAAYGAHMQMSHRGGKLG